MTKICFSGQKIILKVNLLKFVNFVALKRPFFVYVLFSDEGTEYKQKNHKNRAVKPFCDKHNINKTILYVIFYNLRYRLG